MWGAEGPEHECVGSEDTALWRGLRRWPSCSRGRLRPVAPTAEPCRTGPARWEQGSKSHIHYVTNCSQRRGFGQEFFRPSRQRLYFVLMMHFLSSTATPLLLKKTHFPKRKNPLPFWDYPQMTSWALIRQDPDFSTVQCWLFLRTGCRNTVHERSWQRSSGRLPRMAWIPQLCPGGDPPGAHTARRRGDGSGQDSLGDRELWHGKHRGLVWEVGAGVHWRPSPGSISQVPFGVRTLPNFHVSQGSPKSCFEGSIWDRWGR